MPRDTKSLPTPEEFAAYLTKQGWTFAFERDGWIIYKLDRRHGYAAVPARTEQDYERRVREVIAEIARVEHREAHEVAADISPTLEHRLCKAWRASGMPLGSLVAAAVDHRLTTICNLADEDLVIAVEKYVAPA